MTWTWDDFPHDPPRIGAEVRLPANGWQALLAFLAGPGWVYTVASIDPETIPVADGTGNSSEEAWTDYDRRAVRDGLLDYLRTAGIPDPPEDVEWRLVLPEALTEDQLWAALNQAASDGPPFAASTADAVVARLRAAVRDLLPLAT